MMGGKGCLGIVALRFGQLRVTDGWMCLKCGTEVCTSAWVLSPCALSLSSFSGIIFFWGGGGDLQ